MKELETSMNNKHLPPSLKAAGLWMLVTEELQKEMVGALKEGFFYFYHCYDDTEG